MEIFLVILGIQGLLLQFSRCSVKSTLNIIERTDAETKAPKCWPPDVKSPLIGEDPDAGKD